MGGVEEHKGDGPPPPQGLSSSEVNFLVYRYLLESGFGHAAFAFGNESDVSRVDVRGKDVPVGALVSFIQKGFQLVELEANLNANGTDVYGKYVQFSANDILTKDLGELRRIAEEIQDEREGKSGGDDKEEVSPSKGSKKGKKNKRAKVEVSALEGANGVALTQGVLPPLEVEMDVDVSVGGSGGDNGDSDRGNEGVTANNANNAGTAGTAGTAGNTDRDGGGDHVHDHDRKDDGMVEGGDARAVVAPRSPVSSPSPEDSAPSAQAIKEGAEEKDVKDEVFVDVKTEGEGEGQEARREASEPPGALPSPPPPPPSGGEQMDVDDSLWDKQHGSSAGAVGKNDNAPFEANGVDMIPPPPPEE